MRELSKSKMLAAVCAASDQRDPSQSIAELPVEQRIASAMPLMIKHISEFWAGLMPREQAACDIEDLTTIVWIELREKDRYFNPEIAKYTTWASTVAKHKLGEERNYMRAVHAPRNSFGRLRNLTAAPECADEDDADATRATAMRDPYRSSVTADAIRTAMREPFTMDCNNEEALGEEDDAEAAADRIIMSHDVGRLLRRAIHELGSKPAHLLAIKMSFGIGSLEPSKLPEVAARLGCSLGEARTIKADALRMLAEKIGCVDSGDSWPEFLLS